MSPGPAAAAAAADLRLVPPALCAWATALAVVHAPHAAVRGGPVALGLLALAGAAVVSAALRWVLRGPRGGRPVVDDDGRSGGARRALPAVALCLATAALVVVSGAAAQQVRAPHALLAAAATGRTVEVVGRVSTEPRPAAGDTRERFTVTASAVRRDGAWVRVRGPVEVVAPAGAVLGSAVHLHGVASTTTRGDRAAVRLRADRAPRVTAGPHGLTARAARVRLGAREVARDLPPDVRGLLSAVTVGSTADVPADLVEAMRTSGLAHVMAVSGAHFAIVGALVLAVTASLGAPRPLRVAAAGAAGVGLLLVVGPEPSVVRAAVMGAVGLLGLLAGRRSAGPAALAAAVVVLLVADPWLAVDVGFALSVGATAGLVVLGAPMVARWSPRCGRDVAALLAAPVAAQLGCLPVTLALWPTFGPWSVAANVAVAPAVAPATVLGLGAALLAGPWPSGAAVLAAGAGAACWWIAAVARWTSGLPGAALAWWPGAGGAVAAATVVLAVAALVLRPPGPPGR
ncbi:ComEC/Rec2 family competence protein [Cellulomonas phragmiteti]|uniref:Competence protein n=1 Tax=Cellulomonas phragmiteti TaxID=478780 RepID=A0ABQ4DKL0_9CELL|nr:ComEC/Rec2 family competence protein [Cellulomonas phragmiteti]GIG39889.1 competence protein [Cellulomonas phragmiteti]